MYRVISWVYTVDKDSTNFRGSQNKTSFYRYQSQSKVSAIVTDIFFFFFVTEIENISRGKK